MRTPADYRKIERRRQVVPRIVAGIVALSLGFLFLIGPMYVFRVWSGIPMDAKWPEGEIWWLIVGCGLGSGAAYSGFHLVLSKFGGLDDREIDALWRGRDQ